MPIKYLTPPPPVDWEATMQKLARDFQKQRKPDPAQFNAYVTAAVKDILASYADKFLMACTKLLWEGPCIIHNGQLALDRCWIADDFNDAETISYFDGEYEAGEPHPQNTLPTPIVDSDAMMPPSFTLQLADAIVDSLPITPEQKHTWKLENRLAWERYYPNRAYDTLGWLLCLLPAYRDVGQPDPATYMNYIAQSPTLLDIPTTTPVTPKTRPTTTPPTTPTAKATPQLTLF